MSIVRIGISDCSVSSDPEANLHTCALGSCIAVAIADPARKVGGLLHFMLPDSAIERAKSDLNPYMFADTGIAAMLRQLAALRADRRRLVIWLAGGAQLLNDSSLFQIGRKNHAAALELLGRAGLRIDGEAVGGNVSRSVRLQVATGRFFIREGAGREWELTPQATIGRRS